MSAEDPMIHLPDRQCEILGITNEEIDQYPLMAAFTDVTGYAAADSLRLALVGPNGTNLQMLAALDGDEDPVLIGCATLFLVKNRIRPRMSDLELLIPLMQETARRLALGDLHAVNRRHELRENGVLTMGDDVVPDEVRAQWINADAVRNQ